MFMIADATGPGEDAMAQLQNVGVQSDLADEVRDDGVRIRLLHFG
jgi:hypothetical protein